MQAQKEKTSRGSGTHSILERVRSMSDEELVDAALEFFSGSDVGIAYCRNIPECECSRAEERECIRLWLTSPIGTSSGRKESEANE